MEIWKSIPGFEGRYEVSSLGRVRNTLKRRILKPTPSNGYLTVKLGGRTRTVHALVADVFVPGKFPGANAMHMDGSRDNNARTNLKWGTVAENASHRRIHGTERMGERHGMSKLNDRAVAEIRATEGKALKELAVLYGVHPSLISLVRRNRIWRHV